MLRALTRTGRLTEAQVAPRGLDEMLAPRGTARQLDHPLRSHLAGTPDTGCVAAATGPQGTKLFSAPDFERAVAFERFGLKWWPLETCGRRQ